MTLYSAGACSYRSVDHEVAAEYDGGGNENRCDDKKENVRDVRMSPFAGAICEKNVINNIPPAVQLWCIHRNGRNPAKRNYNICGFSIGEVLRV